MMKIISRNQKILVKKLIENRLHHLLILRSFTMQKREQIKYIEDVISEYIFHYHKRNIDPSNHPDFLRIDCDKYLQKKLYHKAAARDIYRFLEYKSLHIPKKLILIDDLSKLSTVHINKLLKAFEEPSVPVTIFLLNPANHSIMQTLKSRAIFFPISLEQGLPKENIRKNVKESHKITYDGVSKLTSKLLSDLKLDSLGPFKEIALHQFLEICKKNHDAEYKIADFILSLPHHELNHARIKIINHYLKDEVVDKKFNYRQTNRLILLHQVLTDVLQEQLQKRA